MTRDVAHACPVHDVTVFIVVAGCLQLLDQIPDCVHRVSDIIVVVAARNGVKWRNAALEAILKDVRACGQHACFSCCIVLSV